MTTAAELYACLYATEFPAQALLRLRPEMRDRGCAVMEGNPPLQFVCSMTRKARSLGMVRTTYVNASGLPADEQLTTARDQATLKRIFDTHPVSGAIHFAALKSVGESVAKPIEYYDNNVGSLLALLAVMRDRNVKQFVFSSSATVYGDPATVPVAETAPMAPTRCDF